MPSSPRLDVIATGVGVVTAVGQGKPAFTAALMEGRAAFGVMQRPGRQLPGHPLPGHPLDGSSEPAFLGAELAPLVMPAAIPAARLRTASLSAQAAIACLHEAWHEAQLDDVDPTRIGLVVGGSNVQQRELVAVHDAYRDRPHFLRPTYSLQFMDTDLCGLCSELFGIRGLAFTVGGASASGQLAVLQAHQLLQSDQLDVCIAIGALMDLSYWECQALRTLGAMGSYKFADQPAAACRPFDRDHDGFIYGECSAAIVLERADRVARRGVAPYARVLGGAIRMDANRNTDPSLDGELAAVQGALAQAGVPASSIDYVNPHGTGSPRGDAVEAEALHRAGLAQAYISATKSITGHGLSAAGAVELAAVLLQMRAGRVHATRNLEHPEDERCNWVRGAAVDHAIQRAVKLSMGFGGINTALCLEAIR